VKEEKFIPVSRDTMQCKQGERAHSVGMEKTSCPYHIGDNRRTGWLTGWYDSFVRHRFRDLFARYGATYP
jgi:ribosome modulation factor